MTSNLMPAILHGIFLAFGLIVPLGVQNLFVFNQGAVQPNLIKALPQRHHCCNLRYHPDCARCTRRINTTPRIGMAQIIYFHCWILISTLYGLCDLEPSFTGSLKKLKSTFYKNANYVFCLCFPFKPTCDF